MKTKMKHVMLYLLIVSMVATGVSLSRFSSTLTNSGAENTTPPGIEFSTWVLDHQADSISLKDMVPGVSKTVEITVKNWKESGETVKVSGYDQSFNLELETTGNLPLVYSLRVKDGDGVLLSRVDSFRYLSDSRTFTADIQETKSFIMTMTWPGEIKAEQYRHEIDHLELRIKAVQI